MEQGSNLGVHFVASNNPSSQQPGLYPNLSQTHQIPQVPKQQGQVFYSPQVLVDANAVTVMSQNNDIRNIELRISTGFCCYTCLVWFEMLVAIVTYVVIIAGTLQGAEIAISTLTTITLLPGCVLTLIAKNKFDAKKQNIAFILFILSTILGLLASILSLVYSLGRTNIVNIPDCIIYISNSEAQVCTEYESGGVDALCVVFILALVWQLIIGLTLTLNARSLMMLMRTRDNLMIDNKDKLDMNVFVKV